MKEHKEELEVLRNVINAMDITQGFMKDCDNVTNTEFRMFNFYLQELEDRAIKLENKINSYTIEEV